MAKNKEKLVKKLIVNSSLGIAGTIGAVWLGRKLIKKISNSILKRIMTDPYAENLWEFVSASRKYGLQTIVETNLRTQAGSLINGL